MVDYGANLIFLVQQEAQELANSNFLIPMQSHEKYKVVQI
jgi:hypothetical protein